MATVRRVLMLAILSFQAGTAATQPSPRDPLPAGPAVPWREESGGRITEDDIDQRAKFNKLASHKDTPRQQIINELIEDRMKFLTAHRYGIEPTDKDVDAQYEEIAKRMHQSADELTQMLARSGVDAATLKAKILADLSWQHVIRSGHKDDVASVYTLQPILFLMPNGNTALLQARRKEADALRARFADCESGLPDARAQHDVVIREQIMKNSMDLPPALRDILSKTGLGHLTPPETTEKGVQMFAICDVRSTPSYTSLPEPFRYAQSLKKGNRTFWPLGDWGFVDDLRRR
jgi:peptidyl-prolyl cis-trans isomerase SurA